MQREFLIFLITIGALCSVTVSGEGQTPAANKTAGTQEPEPNKKQDTDNTETGQTAFTRALAGTDISGASSADSQQGYFIDFDLTAPLKKCDPSEPENCRFWGWVNPRILSLTAPGSSAGDAGVLTPLTNAFTTTSSASNLTKLVAGFEFLAGADVMLKNGQGFPKILPNTIVSIEWTVSAGTSTPFSAANAAQIFTVNNAIRLKFPAVTTGCPDSTATTPAAPACQYIAFIPPNRDRFFRQYFTGLRFKSFYRQNENGAKDKHGESFPGTLDVTAGQSELVTGGILRGLILKIEGFYPLPFP